MRTALPSGCWLLMIAVALPGAARADESGATAGGTTSPPQTTSAHADQDAGRSAGSRDVELGDGNRVHYRSPIHVLSHLQVNIQITIGAPAPDNQWPPAAGGAAPQSADAPPAAQDHLRSAQQTRPTARRAGSDAARARTRQQARRRLRRFDTDGDGRLDRAELEQKLPARRVDRWMKTIDTDGDGRLSLEELSTAGAGRGQRSSPGG